MNIFEVVDEGGPTVGIRNVPVFRVHNDRNYVCDHEWLDRCVADFLGQKSESVALGVDAKYAMMPPITVGHTPEDPNAQEPPSVGFVDNLQRHGDFLLADFHGLSRGVYDQIKQGQYPYRSAEVIPSKHRLTNVSLLGGRYPHFALPVMRFKSDGLDKVRYFMKGPDMGGIGGTVGGDMASGMGGGGTGGTNPGGKGPDLQALAQAVAPIVCQILTEKSANDMPTQLAAAYAAHAVQRHEEETDAAKHTDDTADAAEDDSVSTSQDEESTDFGGDEQGKGKEDFKGDKKDSDKMALKNKLPDDAARYISSLKGAVDDLTGQVQKLMEDNGALKRHNVQQAQAAKRTMLTSKCKELAALGYTIGDSTQIQRHVERMMGMKTDEVASYIEDVLKGMPKVPGGIERHGVHDFIQRPGVENENERYYADNRGLLDDMGLDNHVLDLADVLG